MMSSTDRWADVEEVISLLHLDNINNGTCYLETDFTYFDFFFKNGLKTSWAINKQTLIDPVQMTKVYWLQDVLKMAEYKSGK